jgi:hypothetical protein
MIALKDHQLRVLDSSRDFFRITSRTAHSEEAFRQITERTFGTAWSYLSARVAGVEPDRGTKGCGWSSRKSKETSPDR